jgi:hypothetical protein
MLAVFRDEARLVRCRVFVARLARDLHRFAVHLGGEFFHAVVGLGDARCTESVRFDDVGAGREVLVVDLANDLRLRDRQQFVVALDVAPVVLEALAAIGCLVELVALDHRAHRAVEYEDAPLQQRGQRRAARVFAAWRASGGGRGG